MQCQNEIQKLKFLEKPKDDALLDLSDFFEHLRLSETKDLKDDEIEDIQTFLEDVAAELTALYYQQIPQKH